MIFLTLLLSPISLVVGLITRLIFFIVIIFPLLYNELYELDENSNINLDFTDNRMLLGEKFCFIWFYYDELYLDKKTNKWMKLGFQTF